MRINLNKNLTLLKKIRFFFLLRNYKKKKHFINWTKKYLNNFNYNSIKTIFSKKSFNRYRKYTFVKSKIEKKNIFFYIKKNIFFYNKLFTNIKITYFNISYFYRFYSYLGSLKKNLNIFLHDFILGVYNNINIINLNYSYFFFKKICLFFLKVCKFFSFNLKFLIFDSLLKPEELRKQKIFFFEHYFLNKWVNGTFSNVQTMKKKNKFNFKSGGFPYLIFYSFLELNIFYNFLNECKNFKIPVLGILNTFQPHQFTDYFIVLNNLIKKTKFFYLSILILLLKKIKNLNILFIYNKIRKIYLKFFKNNNILNFFFNDKFYFFYNKLNFKLIKNKKLKIFLKNFYKIFFKEKIYFKKINLNYWIFLNFFFLKKKLVFRFFQKYKKYKKFNNFSKYYYRKNKFKNIIFSLNFFKWNLIKKFFKLKKKKIKKVKLIINNFLLKNNKILKKKNYILKKYLKKKNLIWKKILVK